MSLTRGNAVFALLFCVLAATSSGARTLNNVSPVAGVVDLLKTMLTTLEADAKTDNEIYEKFSCWCEVNGKEKTQAIADAEASIEQLTSEIEQLSAQISRLIAEIAGLEADKAANEKALGDATSLRTKEAGEFATEEQDLTEAIDALGRAMEVLEKHQGSLLQLPRDHLKTVATTLQKQVSKHAYMLKGVLTNSERRAIDAFVQEPDYFDAKPTFKQSYAPQSGEIFGILSQMNETFSENLASAQAEESAKVKAYEELKAAKEAEIAAGDASILAKGEEKTSANSKKVTAEQDKVDTEAALSADQAFLLMLNGKCAETDAQREQRLKTRQEEIKTVSEAIAVLTSDDAKDLFTRTLNFAQLGRSVHSQKRNDAAKVLALVSQKTHNPKLMALSTKVRLDAFTRVKEAIDDMIAALNQEMADEVKHKDFCDSSINENELATQTKNQRNGQLDTTLEGLATTLTTLTTAIDTLKSEVADLQLQLKTASETREAESFEFQETMSDQKATQTELEKALAILEKFYGKSSFAQVQSGNETGEVGPPPPPGFVTYENQASDGVTGLLKSLINQAAGLASTSLTDELAAEGTYASFVSATTLSIDTKAAEIATKLSEKAKAEEDTVLNKNEKDEVMQDLERLSAENAQLHATCDFITKNFDLRQTARGEEIQALEQAKNILSGME